MNDYIAKNGSKTLVVPTYSINHKLYGHEIFKPGARLVSQNCFCPRMSVCVCVCVFVCVFVCVCVSAPKAINNQWRDMV